MNYLKFAWFSINLLALSASAQVHGGMTYKEEVEAAAAKLYQSGEMPGFKHRIGELYGGGYIISLWNDNGEEHGIIVATTNLYPFNADSIYRLGQKIPAVSWDQADSLCKAYTAGGFNNWRLPTLPELDTLNKFNKKMCSQLGHIGHQTSLFMKGSFWSATVNAGDSKANSFWAETFNTIYQNYDGNSNPIGSAGYVESVRAIRNF